jgi:hypothetical protein
MGRSINGRNFDKVNPWTVASDADSSTVGQRQAEMIVDGIEKDKILEINPTVSGWIGDYSGVNERRGQLSGPKTRRCRHRGSGTRSGARTCDGQRTG